MRISARISRNHIPASIQRQIEINSDINNVGMWITVIDIQSNVLIISGLPYGEKFSFAKRMRSAGTIGRGAVVSMDQNGYLVDFYGISGIVPLHC